MRKTSKTRMVGAGLFGMALAAGISVSIAPSAEADTILTYTGNNFNSVSGIYSTTDHLTASLVLSAPLGANLTDYGVTPVSWTFNDGIHALSSSLSGASLSRSTFYTDSSGSLTGWNIQAILGSLVITTENHIVLSGLYQVDASYDYSGPSYSFGERDNAPGVWAVSTSPTPTPLPASLPLFVGGLGVLGFLTIGIKRKSATSLAT